MPEEVVTEVAIFTRVGVARIMRYAFRLSQSRHRKLLTVVTKSNAQRHGMVMWDEIAAEVGLEFPDVAWDKMLVDAMTVCITLHPESLDTIVATNLHADILCGLGHWREVSALPRRRTSIRNAGFPPCSNPSMAPPSITPARAANPIATFWSDCLMLEHLGEMDAACCLMRAIEDVCAGGLMTSDVGGKATTREVTDAVIAAIRGANIFPIGTTVGNRL